MLLMERCLASYCWAHEPRPGVLNGKWLGCYWDDMGPGHHYKVRLDQWQSTAIDTLTRYIKEIIDGASNAPMDTGLLCNYLTDQDSCGHGFGKLQLTEWLSFSPAAFDQTYVAWADSIRGVLGIKNRNPHVRANGTVTPVINPYAWQDKSPYKGTSPEANSFVMLLYVAWRDCVQVGNCPPTPAAELSSTRNILYAPRLCHLHSSKCLSMNSTPFLFHAAGCDLF